MQDLACQAGFRLDVVNDFGHPTRPWAVFAGQGGSAGSADMRIGLLATLRDEIESLPRFFRLLEALEADSRVERLFCSFYENDSSDKTPELLAAWLSDRPGVLQSERLGAPRLRGLEISRTMRMAEARNKALAGFADERLDWLVVIDDLYAKPSHIWQLIECFSAIPVWPWPVPVPCKPSRYLRS